MPVPELIRPMLATGGGEPFDDPDWAFEIKWDGIRCLAIRADDGSFRLQNRHLSIVTQIFPELSFGDLPVGTVIDGEVVAFKDGLPSFHSLARRAHLRDRQKIAIVAESTPVHFMAFDLLYSGGEPLTRLTLSERRERLTGIVSEAGSPRLTLTDQMVGEGKAYYEAAAEKGFEGLIAKRLRSRYRFGHRSRDWVKIVAWREEDLLVLGFEKEAGAGRIRSLALGRADGEVYLGRIGDFEEDEAEELYRALEPAPRRDPPAGATPSLHWRRTGLRARVRFFTDPHTGRMRHAKVLGWHPGA